MSENFDVVKSEDLAYNSSSTLESLKTDHFVGEESHVDESSGTKNPGNIWTALLHDPFR